MFQSKFLEESTQLQTLFHLFLPLTTKQHYPKERDADQQRLSQSFNSI